MRIYRLILSIFFIIFINFSLFADGANFKIFWDVSDDSNAQALGVEGNEFVYINNYGIPFYTDNSTIWRTSEGKAIHSEMNGKAPISHLTTGNNSVNINFQLVDTDGNPVVLNRGSASGQFTIYKGKIKYILCTLYLAVGEQSNGCQRNITFTYQEIDPEGYEALIKLRNDIQYMINSISGRTDIEMSLYANGVDLTEAIDKIINGDLSDINPEDFKGILSDDAYNALRDAKRAWDNARRNTEDYENKVNEYEDTIDALESQIEEEFNETRDSLYDINNTTTEELIDEDIDPEDNSLTDYGITEINMDSIDIPNIDESVDFDWHNNIYDDQANQVIAALEAERFRDRKKFIFIINAWSYNQLEIDAIIRSRAGVINGEMEAFLQAYYKVKTYIDTYLDSDFYFKDSIGSQFPDLKDDVDRIAEHFPEEAAMLKEELNNTTWIYDTDGTLVRVKIQAFREAIKRLSDTIDYVVGLAMDQIEEAERQRELEELKRMAALTPEVLTNIKRSVVECITLSTITGDFGDFFELTTGIDACTGERLGISGRIAAGLGLIVGSRLFWNMVGNGLVDTSRAVTKQIEKGVDDFIAFLNKYGISSPSEMVHFISFSRKHWDLKVASHVVEGDIGTHGIISKLTGGMHTSKGLSKSMNEVTKVKIDGESVDWVVKNIDDPTNNLSFVVGVHGRVTNTNVILKKTLPNGVSILQLPREFGNKGVFTKDALINGVDGYKGMKSLFPSHWDFKDITNATEHIIKDKAAAGVIIPSIGEKEIYGFYHIANEPPVKIRINFTDGKITTSHPTWNQ